MKKITSKENDLIKHIIKLKERKNRKKYGEFIIEGIKLIKEAINEKLLINKIIICEESIEKYEINEYIENELKNIECINVSKDIIKYISDVETSQGILAIVKIPNKQCDVDYTQDLILALDNIQDPGNFGTIIRTADSAGLTQILISKETTDYYSQKVIRSTMGAIFRIKIIECEDICKTIQKCKLKNYKILATSLSATKTIYDANFEKSVVVMGNEANGVSNEILKMVDEKIIIPMQGKTESLNVSVATGIILYEYIRKKLY